MNDIIKKIELYSQQERCLTRLAYISHHLGNKNELVRLAAVMALRRFELPQLLLDKLSQIRDTDSSEDVLQAINAILTQ